MEFRSLLAIILSMLVLIGFQYLSGNLPGHPVEQAPNRSGMPPTAQTKNAGSLEGQTAQMQRPNGTAIQQPPAGLIPKVSQRIARDITVETDLYRMVFSERGAVLKECLLKRYSTNMKPDSPPVNLINTSQPDLPLGIELGTSPPVDLLDQTFDADKPGLVLTDSKKEGSLSFSYRLPNGSSVLKTYTFHQGSYWVDLSIEVKGRPGTPVTIFMYNRPFSKETSYVFSGPAYYAKDALTEVKLSKPGEKSNHSGPIDWIGYEDNYFLAAIIPLDQYGGANATFEKKDASGLTAISLTLPLKSDEAGDSVRLGLYYGPKEIETLKALDHHLADSIDFGWFTPIAKPLLYLLNFLYSYFHNYGIAIIIITLLIKIAFWPLAHKSAKSMKTMQKLQPKLAKLKEKYANDKEALNRELMQLYKTYKVNPMSGCLPMLLQIPVFFALYKVLLQAIELRHAPFALWIKDLSAPDRLMIPGVVIPILGGIPVLTLFMGASMYLQQKMTPSSLDPTQAKMMQILPVVFTFMFINFPSGLVLYWLVNNLFSIVQQYYINKFTE
ncbi:MAG: membrane protein insertase YidC [Dissulfurimicrobium sp.]|uniref:membrane protein insertase YidC n=1 Tax=Dissulfurimicrobium hydrothermale TaxID=1750598 RepID=UPI003C73F493